MADIQQQVDSLISPYNWLMFIINVSTYNQVR